MKTDDFIRTLSSDHGWCAPPVAAGLWLGLALAVPVSIAIFMVELGPRPDFMSVLGSPFFDLKFVVTLALAASAFAVVLSLARPGAAPRRWLLLLPLAILAAGIVADLMMQSSPWQRRMMGSNAMVCLVSIPLLSAPFLAAALVALRGGASTRPALSGAIAGLLAGGLGATLYAAHCVDDSPLFVALWYSLGVFGVAAVGALAGRRALKF
jgi:hypothetical protein